MKITPTQYATTLYELTQDKGKSEIDAVVKKFTELLIKNNQLKLADKIIAKFSEICNKKHGIIGAEIITREKVGTDAGTQIRTYIIGKYKAKEVVLNNIVNPDIKGGVVMKVGDEILDGSVAGKLANLKNILAK